MKRNSCSSNVKVKKAKFSTRLNKLKISNSQDIIYPIKETNKNILSPKKFRNKDDSNYNFYSKNPDKSFHNEFNFSPSKKIISFSKKVNFKTNTNKRKSSQKIINIDCRIENNKIEKLYKIPVVSKDSNLFFSLFESNKFVAESLNNINHQKNFDLKNFNLQVIENAKKKK